MRAADIITACGRRGAGRRLVAAATTLVLLALGGRYGPHRDEPVLRRGRPAPRLGLPRPAAAPPTAGGGDAGAAPALGVGAARALGAGHRAAVPRDGGDCGRAWVAVPGPARSRRSRSLRLDVPGGRARASTTTLDVLAWATVVWLVLRALRLGWRRGWLLVGAVAGVGLQNKSLLVLLLAALTVGLLVVPDARRRLPWRWVLAAGGLAALLWLPNLAWQAANGWPQRTSPPTSRTSTAGRARGSRPWRSSRSPSARPPCSSGAAACGGCCAARRGAGRAR
nr:glycosyltransferase family 39 protein [Angustibacter aerolatus]